MEVAKIKASERIRSIYSGRLPLLEMTLKYDWREGEGPGKVVFRGQYAAVTELDSLDIEETVSSSGGKLDFQTQRGEYGVETRQTWVAVARN